MTTETKMTDARELLNRALPFLLDEAAKYEDDGSNEPLELARDIESFLATPPSDESALSSASSALDGGEVAARLRGEGAPPEQHGQAVLTAPASDDRICSVCDGGPGNDGPCLCGERRWEQPAPSAPVGVAEAWQEGYRQGVLDERISEANIGVAGFGAKVEPARNNPYALAQQPAVVDGDGSDEEPAEPCESALPGCGPAVAWDSEGIGACERCAKELGWVAAQPGGSDNAR